MAQAISQFLSVSFIQNNTATSIIYMEPKKGAVIKSELGLRTIVVTPNPKGKGAAFFFLC